MPPVAPAPRASDAYDLVVVGCGPAGEKAAAQAAYFGKAVAVVERAPEPGGAGVHTGTLPSKTLRETALYLSGYQSRALYGVSVTLDRSATLAHLMARKDAIARSESARIRANLARHGVTYHHGRGRIVDPHRVAVEGPDGLTLLSGEYLLVATGSRPLRPDGIDFSSAHIHDSDELLGIQQLPERLTVLGGGVIGCEYACMFAALGTHVTLVDPRERLLSFLDDELVEHLLASMRRLGIDLRAGVRWTSVTSSAERVETRLAEGSLLDADQLLVAAGRLGNTEGLGLAELGVELDGRGYVQVDQHFRTRVPSILAAGDVVGFPSLASASMEQGRVAVCQAFGFGYKTAISATMPYGLYTIPEASGVGETEASARLKGLPVVVGRAPYADNARGKIVGDTEGLLKLVACARTKRLLGVHVIGESATELVHVGQTVLHLAGSIDLFIDMVWNFPTLAECYKYAAYECLAALQRGA